MDGRGRFTLTGSASYYLNRGINDSTGIPTGSPSLQGFKPFASPNISYQSGIRDGSLDSPFQIQNPSNIFSSGIASAPASSTSLTQAGKKKRGRPRKYGPGVAKMSLGLSPMSSMSSPGSMAPSSNRPRGRPPGSGWKQKLAPFGEWMNNSAGLAFTPHIIHVGFGEDIAATVLSFAQQRPRALCILSANGAVSELTLRQPAGGPVTYEGHLEILCLSGSYLVAENGGPRNRTGGLSISVCSPDGHLIGGAIGGKLIAARPAQVVVCSFVYDGLKKNKAGSSPRDDKNSEAHPSAGKVATVTNPFQNFVPNSSMGVISSDRNLHTGIDLTWG